MCVHQEAVFGTIGHQNPPVHVPIEDRKLLYRSPGKTTFSVSRDMTEKHIVCIGGPGSGKTNVMNLTLKQLRSDSDSANHFFVIFDTKGDYIKRFYRPGDYVIATGTRYSNYPGYVRWNLFKELEAAGDDWRLMAREIAKGLFADRANQTQPFFSNSAEDLFAALLIHFYKHHRGDPKVLNNQHLIKTIRQQPTEWYINTLCNPDINPEFVGMKSYFGTGTSNQALGVFGELKSMVYGSFADAFEQPGTFSIRNAVRARGGRAVFIEYDVSIGQSLTPMYRLLVDLALKETMSRQGNSEGRVWYVLDELKLLPHCIHLEDGLNLARGLNCSILAGLQSVNQLYEIYGKERGQVILGGFSNVFAFSTTDYESRDYITNLFGKNIVKYWVEAGSIPDPQVRVRDGHVVEDWDLLALTTGCAYIGLLGHPPFPFHFEEYRSGT